MSPALAIALGAMAAALALTASFLAWAVRGWRRERQQVARIVRAQARARLTQQMRLRRDTQPAPIDETYLQLEALYRAPTHTERGNQ